MARQGSKWVRMGRGLAVSMILLAGLPAPVLAQATPSTQSTQAGAVQVSAARININTASSEQLAEGLDGVGQVKAQAIIDYREQFGPFKAVDELLEVKGIGPALLEKNRSRIVLR